MDYILIIMIAIGLSLDSFAVSVSNGLSIKPLKPIEMFYIAFSLALFQGLMPILGWSLGIGIEKYIKVFDHWIAFTLLGMIGIKMLYEGFTSSDNSKMYQMRFTSLIAQSIATSIDALIMGIGFALLGWNILIPSLIIGITTLLFSIIGLRIGKWFGNKIGRSATVIGGLVLIAIGTKILIEHLYLQ